MARTRIHGQQVTDGSIELVDLSSALAATISGKADAGNLAPVATSGSYNDLSDLPSLFSGSYTDLTNKPTLFSGSYNDLSDKPTLGSLSGSLNDLSDVAVSSAVKGQFIVHDGTQFVNSRTIEADVAATVPLTVKGAASQSGNLFQIQDSSATVLASVSAGGMGTFNGGIRSKAGGIFDTSAYGVGFAVTGTGSLNGNNYQHSFYGSTNAPALLAVSQGIHNAFACGNGSNEIFNVNQYGTGINARSFETWAVALTVNNNHTNPTTIANFQSNSVTKISFSKEGNITASGTGTFNAPTATNKGLIVKGAASQTANLFEVQNSSSTVLFSIDSAGSVAAGTVPVARVSGLHAVATSGSYDDLSNKPTIPSITGLATESYVDSAVAAVVNSAPAVLNTLNELAAALGNDENFATTVAGQIGDVAGDVSALDLRVTAAEGDISDLQTDVAAKADSASLATVATSGSYNDLLNKPTLFSGSYTDLSNKPTLVSVLDDLSDVTISSPSNDQVLKYNGTAWVNSAAPATFSGSYNDLTNKPTLASFTTLTSPANGQFLMYNGTAWINSALPEASTFGVKGIVNNTTQFFEGIKTFVGEGSGGNTGPGASIRIANPNFKTWAQEYITLSNTTGALDIFSNITNNILRLRSVGDGFNNKNFLISYNDTNRTFDFTTSSFAGDPSAIPSINIANTLGVGLNAVIGAKFQVNTGAAATKGIIVRGAASQTAFLFEAQNSSSQRVFSINPDGGTNIEGNVVIRKTNPQFLMINTNVTPGGNAAGRSAVWLLQYSGEGQLDLGNTTLGGESFADRILTIDLGTTGVGFNTERTSIGGQVHITPKTTSTKGLVVRGAASQSANLFEAQNSSGTGLVNISASGRIGIKTSSPLMLLDVKSEGEFTVGGGNFKAVAVFQKSTANKQGAIIGYNDSGNGSAIIAGACETTGTPIAFWTYNNTAWGERIRISADGLFGVNTTSPGAQLDVVSSAAATKGLIVKAAASQSANLFEAQNSSGTALFSIDKDGSVAAGTVPVARVSGLATVATSGSYADLSNKPTIYTPTKEVLTSLVDGTETEFVLAATPNAGAYVQVFLNGLLQSEGASEDYTISGDTITFNSAPESGWKLVVYYFV